MGNVLFRRKKATAEELEELQKRARALEEEIKKATSVKSSTQIFALVSVVFFIVVSVVSAVVYEKSNNRRMACSLGTIFIGFVVLFLTQWLINRYFDWSIGKKRFVREELSKKKRAILEEVKEKETFKVAKEILDKYDDPEPHFGPPNGRQARMSMPMSPTSIRGAMVEANSSNDSQYPMNPSRGVRPSEVSMTSSPSRSTPRPFLTQRKNIGDRLVDFFFGDGPNNRFALVCSHCFSHNGMALEAEFEYIAYRCYACGEFNPARRQRKRAEAFARGRPSLPPSAILAHPPIVRAQSEMALPTKEPSDPPIEKVKKRQRSESLKRPPTISTC